MTRYVLTIRASFLESKTMNRSITGRMQARAVSGRGILLTLMEVAMVASMTFTPASAEDHTAAAAGPDPSSLKLGRLPKVLAPRSLSRQSVDERVWRMMRPSERQLS